MPILLRELAQGFDKLTCIHTDTTIQQALDLMFREDGGYFSQLPVIDANKRLVGVVSEHSIVEAIREQRNKTFDTMARFTVRQCLEHETSKLSPEDDIFAAMKRLEQASYVMIVEKEVPIGIVTSYDTGKVFGPIGEVLMRARDIEERLREYIGRAFPSESLLKEAAGRAFKDPEKGNFERLTFGDLLEIIWNSKNWPSFEKVFESQDLFRKRMIPARDIRNGVAHFRRTATQSDIREMSKSLVWLNRLPQLPELSKLSKLSEAPPQVGSRIAELVDGLTDEELEDLLYPFGH